MAKLNPYQCANYLMNDMYELDLSTLKWTSKPRRKVRPIGRRGHSMEYLKPSSNVKLSANDPFQWKGQSAGQGNLLLFGGNLANLLISIYCRAIRAIYMYDSLMYIFMPYPCHIHTSTGCIYDIYS